MRLTALASTIIFSRSSTLNSIWMASSASVGWRPSLASSVLVASLSLLALLRTSRGTQSMVRSSSSMAPRMRGTQYVSNLTPRVMSKASMASIRPKTPAEMRSSSSTPSGRRAQIRSPLYFTSGRYCSTSRLRYSLFVGSALYRFQISSISTCFSTVIVAMPSSVIGLPRRKGSSVGGPASRHARLPVIRLSGGRFGLGLGLLLLGVPGGHGGLELSTDRIVHEVVCRLAGDVSQRGEHEQGRAG